MEEVKEAEEPSTLNDELVADKIVVINEQQPAPRRHFSIAVMGTFLLGTIAFLYFAKVFFLPLMLAVMLSLLFKPMVKWLARVKIPQALAHSRRPPEPPH